MELPAISMPEIREKGHDNHGSNPTSSWIGKLLCKWSAFSLLSSPYCRHTILATTFAVESITWVLLREIPLKPLRFVSISIMAMQSWNLCEI